MFIADVHAHLIPRIDDGPMALQESLQMLRMAHAAGTRAMVATPHMFLDPYNHVDLLRVNDRFASFMAVLQSFSRRPGFAFLRELKIYLGSENYLCAEFMEAVDKRHVLTLNGSRYLLVELPLFLSFPMLQGCMEIILDRGFVPVLAHVERHPLFTENPRRLAALMERGCISQVNAQSVLGKCGSRNRQSARMLLNRGLVHVIASDAHDTTSRTTPLGEAFLHLSTRFPQPQVLQWFCEYPARIIQNRKLEEPAPAIPAEPTAGPPVRRPGQVPAGSSLPRFAAYK